MATFEERNTTREAHESIFYERCWRCRCVVPNGLVRRRTMRTGYSKGTLLGTGAALADLDHYEKVSLCGVCYDELKTAELHEMDKSYRRWAWVGRIVGLAYCTLLLTRTAGFPFNLGLSIALAFAYFRMLGRAILTMHVVTPLAMILGYPPPQYATQVITCWSIVWAGLIGWQLWYPELRPWPFRPTLHDGRAKPAQQRAASTASLHDGGPSL